MSQLLLLRATSSLQDVATLLQFRPSALAYILYKKPTPNKYRSFEISKRSGGVRKINAPSPDLRLLQQRLSDLLQNCVAEINETHKRKDDMAHGFKRHKSIITNAKKHHKKRYVLNIDLQDFFPSINFGRIRGFFIKDANFMLHPKVATILAQIACHDNALPQGSPCSPVISNLVGHMLDIHLCKLASVNGCTYSRYADDITFSTNKPVFPTDIAKLAQGLPHKWEPGDKLKSTILQAGFAVNPQKTRMQYQNSRQSVTGLVVNRKVNVRIEYRKTVRAMAQRLFMTGSFQRLWMLADPTGTLVPTVVEGTMSQLHGMLGHIDAIDYHNFEIESKVESRRQQARLALRSKEKLYRRFLMFKDFYAASTPVIVCEGKTDNVYLSCAIKSLAALFPKLASISANNQITVNVRILKTVNTSTGRVLQLEGGAAYLKTFIEQYLIEIDKFKAPGMQQAVVLVVDNDSGGDDIRGRVSNLTKKKAPKDAEYIHLGGNLYVVLTPLKSGATKSVIEECFDDTVLKVQLGGKSFSPDNKANASNHFGKHILSQYVRENAAKIDFNGFAELLKRISAAIEAHESKQTKVVAGATATI